jgi:hypothetical protein
MNILKKFVFKSKRFLNFIKVILPVLKLTDNLAGSVALGVAIPVILTGKVTLKKVVEVF